MADCLIFPILSNRECEWFCTLPPCKHRPRSEHHQLWLHSIITQEAWVYLRHWRSAPGSCFTRNKIPGRMIHSRWTSSVGPAMTIQICHTYDFPLLLGSTSYRRTPMMVVDDVRCLNMQPPSAPEAPCIINLGANISLHSLIPFEQPWFRCGIGVKSWQSYLLRRCRHHLPLSF